MRWTAAAQSDRARAGATLRRMKTAEPFDLEDAWAYLAQLVGVVIRCIATPAAIAERLGLLRKSRMEILAWLAPLEALARRLLVIEAAQTPKPNDPPPRPHFPGGLSTALADRPPEELGEDSSAWRVVFRVWPGPSRRPPKPLFRDPEARPLRDHPLKPIGFTANAYPLARRLEALRRLTLDRRAALARLARLLHARRGALDRAFRSYRFARTPCDSALSAAQREADRVLAAFADTS